MALGKVLAHRQVRMPQQVRRAAGLEPGDVVSFRVNEDGAVEIRALPRLRLSEAWARYRIEGAVEDAADRARWQAKAAEDVLGGRDE
jgi:bifunctional DNA-binding transcriptional regulator/antitoxin component of YhaV-PrlF toxin-antitoxin module